VYPKVIEKVVDANNQALNGYIEYNFYSDAPYNYKIGTYTHRALSGVASNNVFHYGVNFGLGQSKSTHSYERLSNGDHIEKQTNATKYDYGQYHLSKGVYVDTQPDHAFKYVIVVPENGEYTYQLVHGTYDPGQGTALGFVDYPSECTDPGQDQNLSTDRTLASLVLRSSYMYGRYGMLTESASSQHEGAETLSQTSYYQYYNGNTERNNRAFDKSTTYLDPEPNPSGTVSTESGLLKLTITENSEDEVEMSRFLYPDNFPSEYGSLESANILAIPVQTKSYRDGNVITNAKTTYDGVLPDIIQSAKGTNTLENRVYFDTYVEENLVEYHSEDGTYTTVIWGYDHRYPVAKVENATYAQVSALIDYTAIQSLTDQALITALDPVRALPNVLVTSYTYYPLIGVKTMTDPSGYTSTYQYDSFNRLQYIKDADNNVLKQYEYNYGLNDPGGGSPSYDPLVATAMSVNFNDGTPIRSYSGAVTFTGGSGDFTYSWDYKIDSGSYVQFDETSINAYSFQYNVNDADLCDGQQHTITFRCKITDNITANTQTVNTTSEDLDCTNNQ
jgi:YD repeat-containing protein